MENLRRLRLKKHMTQVALQMETGIPQGALSKYERGAALPTADNLAALAAYFHTSMDYLMGLTDEEKPYPPKRKNRP